MIYFTGINSFVVIFGFLSLLSWSLWFLTSSQISNMEKAFGLTSSETGWLLTVWEIGYVICSVLASYFARRLHLARSIGVATIICGLSAFVFALPHFVAFSYNEVIESIQTANTTLRTATNRKIHETLCTVYTNDSSTDGWSPVDNSTTAPLTKAASGSSKMMAYVLFNIGMILQGAGKAPCYPYSSQYIDDNVDQQKTGFYLGIIWGIAVFGLALGYGMGSLSSNMFVTLKATVLSKTDSRYIGAWWLGFLIFGLATTAVSVPMFFFPRQLNGQRSLRHDQEENRKRKLQPSVRGELKHVFETLSAIFRSPLYMLTLMSSVLQCLSLAIFMGFEPKYMETQFLVPAWKANIIVGVVSILSFSIGSLTGGTVTRRWKMTPATHLGVIVVMYLLVTGFLTIATFLGCGSQSVTDPLHNQTVADSLPCSCSAVQFVPVCSEGVTYFSPCHAGCLNGTSEAYSDCSLVPSREARSGPCVDGCQMVWPYSVVKFFVNLVDACVSIPVVIVFLRSAGEDRKALALGLSAAVLSLLGWMPGPVIGGKLIDSTCLVWNTASTSGQYCALYDRVSQRYTLHAIMIGLRVAGILVMLLAVFKARKLVMWHPSDVKLKARNANQLEAISSIEDKI